MLIFFFGSRSIPQSLPGSIPQSLPVSVCVCVFDLAVGVVTPMSSWLKYYLHLLFQLLTKLEAYPAIECRVQARTKKWGRAPLEANASYNYLSEVYVFHVLQVMFQRRS